MASWDRSSVRRVRVAGRGHPCIGSGLRGVESVSKDLAHAKPSKFERERRTEVDRETAPAAPMDCHAVISSRSGHDPVRCSCLDLEAATSVDSVLGAHSSLNSHRGNRPRRLDGASAQDEAGATDSREGDGRAEESGAAVPSAATAFRSGDRGPRSASERNRSSDSSSTEEVVVGVVGVFGLPLKPPPSSPSSPPTRCRSAKTSSFNRIKSRHTQFLRSRKLAAAMPAVRWPRALA